MPCPLYVDAKPKVWSATHKITFRARHGWEQEWLAMAYIWEGSDRGKPFWVFCTEHEWVRDEPRAFALSRSTATAPATIIWCGMPTPNFFPGVLECEDLATGRRIVNRYDGPVSLDVPRREWLAD